MNIIEAIQDPGLFRPLLKDLATWRAWIVFLKALFALPMTEDELSLYRQCTGRETPPSEPFKEAWVPTGRRSGKSFTAALVAVFLGCFRDYRPHLSPGERAMILIIAADRSQAQVIFRYVKGFLAANPMMARMVEAERAESIDLANMVTIQVATCSYKSIRGVTAAAVICDEVAYWAADDGANPAIEVLRAVRPALATIPDSLLLAISSPYARSGPLWQAFQDHHGKDGSDVLCWQAATRLMNPTISQALIDRDMAADPEAARSEWEAIFRADLETFLDLAALESCVVTGRHELPARLAAVPRLTYLSFCDPSGGRRDAAGLAICHREGEVVVLDLCRRWASPHVPSAVVAEMAEILRTYGISKVVGDRYAGSWPSDEFQKHNIRYEPSDRDKSRIYLDFLPLVMSGNVQLLDNKTLISELRGLERRARTGRDSVDHGPGKNQHDDLANSVAGCVTLTGGRKREVRDLLRPLAGRGRPEPKPEPAPLHPRLQYPVPKIPSGKGE